MDSPAKEGAPSGDEVQAKSSTPPVELTSSRKRGVSVAPLSGEGPRCIGVSSSSKREYKDRRIYVNKRTGLPVRPPTSFGIFKHALRRSIKNDKVSFSDFNILASEEWSALSKIEKSLYVQRAKDLAEQYKKVEVRFLRKRVRELQHQNKNYRKVISSQKKR